VSIAFHWNALARRDRKTEPTGHRSEPAHFAVKRVFREERADAAGVDACGIDPGHVDRDAVFHAREILRAAAVIVFVPSSSAPQPRSPNRRLGLASGRSNSPTRPRLRRQISAARCRRLGMPWQEGLRRRKLATRQAFTRRSSGIALPPRRKASSWQAACCSPPI
jgi:hypothetical protein